jgi:hypothetical protein
VEAKQTPNQFTDLTILVGRWTGRGEGGYPTIDSFSYQETLDITQFPGSIALHYLQRTELVDALGNVIRPSHWETGVIRPLEDGRVALASVHVTTRSELLKGVAGPGSGGELKLQFESEQINNDPRMRSSSRTWMVTKDAFHYDMYMATDRVDQPTLHLKALLRREEDL